MAAPPRDPSKKTADVDGVIREIQSVLDKFKDLKSSEKGFQSYCDLGEELRSVCFKSSYHAYRENISGTGFASLYMTRGAQGGSCRMKLKSILDYMIDADIDVCGVAPSVWKHDGKFKLRRPGFETVYVISLSEYQEFGTQHGVDIFLSEKAFDGLKTVERVSSAALCVKLHVICNGKTEELGFSQACEPPEKLDCTWENLFKSLFECFEYKWKQSNQKVRSKRQSGIDAAALDWKSYGDIKSDLTGLNELYRYTDFLNDQKLSQSLMRQAEIYNLLVRLRRMVNSVKVEKLTALYFTAIKQLKDFDLLLEELEQKQLKMLGALNGDRTLELESGLSIMAGAFGFDNRIMQAYYQSCLQTQSEHSESNGKNTGGSLYCTRALDKVIEVVPDYLCKQFSVTNCVKSTPLHVVLTDTTVEKVDDPSQSCQTEFCECTVAV